MRKKIFAYRKMSRNPHTKKTTIRVNKKLSKVARYKINIQISSVFIYISNEQIKNEVKKIPFTIESKRVKYLGVNLTQRKCNTLKTIKCCLKKVNKI